MFTLNKDKVDKLRLNQHTFGFIEQMTIN